MHSGGERREHLCASWRESFTSDRTDDCRYARHGTNDSAKGKRFYRTGASLKIEYAKEHRDVNAAPQDFSPSIVVAAIWTGQNPEALTHLPVIDLMCVGKSQRRGPHARIERLERFEVGHFGNYGR
jgi:hypothetical protein